MLAVHLRDLLLLMLYFLGMPTCGFRLDYTNSAVSARVGDSFLLSCNTDAYYEFCLFKSPNGQMCDYEWKRGVWNLTQVYCPSLEDRVTFVGTYDNFECSIMVNDANIEDDGVWSCEVESYVLGGGRGSGWIVQGNLSVKIESPTTTTIPSTPISPSSTSISIEGDSSHMTIPSMKLLPSFDLSPVKTIRTHLELAKALQVGLCVLVIIVFVVFFTLLVVFHKKRKLTNISVRTEQKSPNTPAQEEPLQMHRLIYKTSLYMQSTYTDASIRRCSRSGHIFFIFSEEPLI